MAPIGGVDASFGQGGSVTLDFAGFNDSAVALAVQPDASWT